MHTEIIPAINSETFPNVAEKIKKVKGRTRWIHLDIADGTFTENILWHTPEDLKEYLASHDGDMPLIEVHLMIKNPEAAIVDWIEAGAKRIIVHVETITDFASIKRACDDAKVLLMLSVAPKTPVQAFDPYIGQNVVCFQILAVHPGLPGQLFQESSYDKIRYIREKCPYCDIEVDGGVKPRIARKCKEAGANLFAAASAVFNAPDIQEAITNLQHDIA